MYSDFFLARAPACIIIPEQLYAHLFSASPLALAMLAEDRSWIGRRRLRRPRRPRPRRLTVRSEDGERGNMNA